MREPGPIRKPSAPSLRALKRRGARIYLLTASDVFLSHGRRGGEMEFFYDPRASRASKMGRLALRRVSEQVDGIHFGDPVDKHDPEYYRLALRRAGMRRSEAVMIGDSYSHDIVPAKKAGLFTVLIDRDGKCGGIPVPKADRRISDLREVLSL